MESRIVSTPLLSPGRGLDLPREFMWRSTVPLRGPMLRYGPEFLLGFLESPPNNLLYRAGFNWIPFTHTLRYYSKLCKVVICNTSTTRAQYNLKTRTKQSLCERTSLGLPMCYGVVRLACVTPARLCGCHTFTVYGAQTILLHSPVHLF